MSKSVKRAIVIAVSAFLFWTILILLKNWYQSSHREGTSSSNKGTGVNFSYAADTTVLPELWKYHSGDDPKWSDPVLNDSSWQITDPELNIAKLPENFFTGICWFRARIHIDSAHANRVFGIEIKHYGASEIFLDGRSIQTYGTVSDRKEIETGYLSSFPMFFSSGNAGYHTMAIRYSNTRYLDYVHSVYKRKIAGITMGFIAKPDEPIHSVELMKEFNFGLIIMFGFFLTLSLVHLLLYIFYRRGVQNLFYSLFAFSFSLFFLVIYLMINSTDPALYMFANHFLLIPGILLLLFLIMLLHSLFRPVAYKVIFLISVVLAALSMAIHYLILDGFWDTVIPIFFTFACIEFIRSIIHGLRKKLPGSAIIGTGALVFALFLSMLMIIFVIMGHVNFTAEGLKDYVLIALIAISIISMPLSMSIYLAYDFSLTNRTLSKKLTEVEELSAKTIEQEREKQEILSKQKENLEIQVTERTKEVVRQKKVIEEKNKDITDSINYAKRIQDAILPSDEQVKNMLPDSFVLYKPKDIVSGDFYFFSEVKERVIAAAVDCTGHGVPGAFMSMVGHNHLKRIVNEQKITDTSAILDELHKQVLYSLNRDITKRDSKDGMDVSIVSIDKQKRELQFSGAVRPLYYFVNGNFNEVKGERYSIAGIKEIGGVSYASTIISVTEPTTFYLFSDGFVDQFGGAEGKKLMSKRFKELLTSIQGRSMPDQKVFLDNFIEDWKGGKEQMDDIMVIGIKL